MPPASIVNQDTSPKPIEVVNSGNNFFRSVKTQTKETAPLQAMAGNEKSEINNLAGSKKINSKLIDICDRSLN